MIIKEQLKKALHQSCFDAFSFSNDVTKLVGAEYLITVNAAKSIQQLNTSFGDPYRIYLEYFTWLFARDCLPFSFKECREINGSTQFDTTRPGKIDIAIYKSLVPECAIEVKGFNPSGVNIKNDLLRNLEYLSLKANTGLSELPRTFFIALHSCKNTMSDKKEVSNLKRIEKRYQNYVLDLSISSHVKVDIDIFTIRRGIIPEKNDPYIQEFGLDGTEDYHFIGVIITFEK